MTDIDQLIVAARHADADAAERWFRLLCDPGQGEERDPAGTVTALRDYDAPAAEALELALANSPAPEQMLRELRDLGADAALARYNELTGANEDPQAWQAFLVEQGPYWDGTEESWQAFRDWFGYEADQAGYPRFAEEFLQYVEDSDDKRAAFADYGIELPGDQDPAESVTSAEEDVAAWSTLLAEKGPYWDGTEENWQAFRDWFGYEAGQAGVPRFAAGFLQYAENAADKRAVFAEYAIQPPPEPARSDGVMTEPVEPPPGLQERIVSAFAQNPGALAALSDADIDKLARQAAEALLAGKD